jgi:arylsulfatase A-like enzyme
MSPLGEVRSIHHSRIGVLVALVLVGLFLFVLEFSSSTSIGIPSRQRVVLVTIDTLRTDFLSANGYPLPTTPYIDELIARGHHFTHAVTPVPRTTPALASLLTGAYPHTTKVRSLVDRLAPEVVSVAELFRARGFRTIAVVSNHVLRRQRGLNRGFEIYDYSGDGRNASATTRAAIDHVRTLGSEEPVFLWVHYIDPHMPYAPPPDLIMSFDPGYAGRYELRFGGELGSTGTRAFPSDLRKREAIYRNPLPAAVNEHIRKLYAADIRQTDDGVRELLGGLPKGAAGDWAVVFTADHGESLGEHDYYWEHGDYVFNSTVRVPLALIPAKGDPLAGSSRQADWVSLVDVMPTLVDLFDLPVPYDLDYEIEGRSLTPYLRGEMPLARPVFAESGKSHYPQEVRGRVHFDVGGRFRAAFSGDWKAIWTPGQSPEREFQLYNVSTDPHETRNLFSTGHLELVRLRGKMEAWVRDTDDLTAEPDARDLEMLRALGYVE